MMIETKDQSVNIWGLEPQMQPVLKEAGALWAELGQTCVVTSARDGRHSWGSLHYYGYAVDLRTHYFADGGAEAAKRLRTRLGRVSPYYDVVLHSTHIHVEFDVVRAGMIPGIPLGG